MHRTLVFLAAAAVLPPPSLGSEPLGLLFYSAEERARLPAQARYGLGREASSLHWAGRIQHQSANGTRHHTDWINGQARRDLDLPRGLKPGQSLALPLDSPNPPPGTTE
jgi:hypothetical protein